MEGAGFGMGRGGDVQGLGLVPSPGMGGGHTPTCWLGEEERQCWNRRPRSSHRSLHVEPEMIPFLYWSHWGGQAERGAQQGQISPGP